MKDWAEQGRGRRNQIGSELSAFGGEKGGAGLHPCCRRPFQGGRVPSLEGGGDFWMAQGGGCGRGVKMTEIEIGEKHKKTLKAAKINPSREKMFVQNTKKRLLTLPPYSA